MMLSGRLLKFGVPTIAAINGHVIAGGLILALALDYRVMNKDFGTARMSEVQLGMSLPRGGNNIVFFKTTPSVHRDLVLRGKSFSPQECLDNRIVDYLVPGDKVMEKAIEIAKEVMDFGEKKRVYQMLKVSSYSDAIKIAMEAKYSKGDVKALQHFQDAVKNQAKL
jgi:Enoyl-CoA hydratase/carnithine racemase